MKTLSRCTWSDGYDGLKVNSEMTIFDGMGKTFRKQIDFIIIN